MGRRAARTNLQAHTQQLAEFEVKPSDPWQRVGQAFSLPKHNWCCFSSVSPKRL